MIYNHLRIKALFVRAKGIEPIRLTAPDPKSGLSTNFNTPATVFLPLPDGKDCKFSTNYLICKIRLLETYTKPDAEAHCKVLVLAAEPVPEFKTMMVVSL